MVAEEEEVQAEIMSEEGEEGVVPRERDHRNR